MTRQEKQSLKTLAKNLIIYVNVVYAIGAIAMIIGTLLIISATQETVTGNEVLIFGVGAAIMIVGMILSAYTQTKYVIPLQKYRNDLLLKKDKHYYDRVCFYTKNNDIDKSVFYFDLIKNTILRDISFGFVLGRFYDMKDTGKYNDIIDRYKDNLNK